MIPKGAKCKLHTTLKSSRVLKRADRLNPTFSLSPWVWPGPSPPVQEKHPKKLKIFFAQKNEEREGKKVVFAWWREEVEK